MVSDRPKAIPFRTRDPLPTMLRLKEIKLPLDHPEAALQEVILKKLHLAAADLTRYTIFKRSYDARKKGQITLVYIVDIETPKEKALLKRFKKTPRWPSPQTSPTVLSSRLLGICPCARS